MTKTTGNFTDFVSFSRASGGTALRRISYGNELTPDPGFSDPSATNTSVTTGYSVTGGQLVVAAATAYNPAVSQNLSSPMVTGKVYQVSYEIVEYTSGGIRLQLTGGGGSANLTTRSAVGTYTEYLVSGYAHTAAGFQSTVAGTTLKIDNISVKEVLFDRADGTLQLFNHPTNVPRVEYDASGNLKGLLIEEARTNYAIYSSNFSVGWKLSRTGVSVAHGGVDDPAGGTSASTFTYSSTNSTEGIFYDLSAGGNTTYVFSIWLKSSTLSQARLLLKNSSSDSIKASAIVNLTSEWQRFSVTGTTDGATAGARIEFTTNGASGSMDIWGAQLEAGAFPTSYIPTSGATATRAADICSIATSAFGYNPNGHTFVVEATGPSAYDPATGANYVVFRLQNATNTSYETIRTFSVTSSSVGVLDGLVIDSSSSQFDANGVGSFTAGTPFKAALAAKKDNFAFMSNGQASVDVDTSGTLPADLSLLYIGCTAGPSRLNGHIKSIRYFPRRLSNAQIQALTA